MKQQQENYDLPEGWSWATLDDIVDNRVGLFKDGDWIETKDQNPEGEVRLIQLADIGDGIFRNRSDRFMSKQTALELNCTFLKKGDVLVARMPDPIGRACLFPFGEEEKFVTVVDVAIIRVNYTDIDKNYLKNLINSPQIRKKIEQLQTGTTRKRISRGNLSTIKLPIAPIEEQKTIGLTLENILNELQTIDIKLRDIQKKLKVYQEVLYKYAFEGKLTKSWREQNMYDYTDIIEVIKNDKEIYYKREIEEWNSLVDFWDNSGKVGIKPKKPKKGRELSDFNDLELLEYPQLPVTWKWTKIDKLIEFSPNSLKAGPFGSTLKKDVYVETGYKVYGQEHAIADNPYIGNYYVTEEKYQELISCSIKPFDILISLVGTVGKVLIIPEDAEKGIINPRLLKISLNRKYYTPKFFQLYFESSFLRNLYKIHTHGATMDVLNLGIIQNLPFPMLSLEEQHEIVKKLEFQFSKVNGLEKTISSGFVQLEMLRQTILKKAFEGRIIPQDMNNEPISKILERIVIKNQNYSAELKEHKKAIPKKLKTMSEDLTIEDVLKTSDKPMNAKEVWQLSKHKSNIEDFYKELKDIQEKIKVVTKGTESLLTLVK